MCLPIMCSRSVKNHLTAKALGSDLPVYPIDVNDSNHLRKSNDEEGNRASEAVEQG